MGLRVLALRILTAHTELVHDIAPDPAFLLCFPTRYIRISLIWLSFSLRRPLRNVPHGGIHADHDTALLFPLPGNTCSSATPSRRSSIFSTACSTCLGRNISRACRRQSGGCPTRGFFLALGALLVVLLPPLIYSRFALALSLYWKPHDPEKPSSSTSPCSLGAW